MSVPLYLSAIWSDGDVFDVAPRSQVDLTVDNNVPYLNARRDVRGNRMRLSLETIHFLEQSGQMPQFLADVDEYWQSWKGGPVLRAVVSDAGKYAKAEKAASEAFSERLLEDTDALVGQVDRLIAQLVELGVAPTRSQAATMATRVADLADLHERLNDAVVQVGTRLDVARIALAEMYDLPARAG